MAKPEPSQQEFLRAAAKELNLTQLGLAERMEVPWQTFRRWLLPTDSEGHRQMLAMGIAFVKEILAHEKLMRSKR